MKSARNTKLKSQTKTKSASTKAKPKPAKALAKKSKKAASATAKAKIIKPVKIDKKALKAESKAKEAVLKAEESSRKAHANPWDPFFDLWKPKSESFEAGLDRFFDKYPLSGKDAGANRTAVVEKLHAQMRKHPLTPAIEEQLFERYPRDRVHKIGSIAAMKPRTTIRLNFLRADLKGFGESQLATDLKIKRSGLSPWAFEVGKPEALPGHPSYGKGLYEVQDESSQLLSLLVNARPGQRILTINSGTGDVALALGAMMKNNGSLFVYESDPRNQKIFKDAATRAHIDGYRILSDAQIGEVKSLDSVLIQAPSSNLGMLGQHPDMKWRFHKEDLGRLHKLQAALLREAGRKLKLGGYVIYATNTLSRSENEQQIDHFIRSSHNSFRVVNMSTHLRDFVIPYMTSYFGFAWDEKLISSFVEYDPFFVLSPDIHGVPGLFVSVMQRTRISS